MQYLTTILIAAMTIFLVGCAKKDVSYITHAQTIHPMIIPLGTKVKKSESYYLVPNTFPSIIRSSVTPPGSDLQRFGNLQLQSFLFNLQQSSITHHPFLQSLIFDRNEGQS